MRTKKLVRVAILGAIGWALLFLEFSILPSAAFLKLNFSDLPALLAAFSMGPMAGVGVVLITNLIHILQTYSAGVGELANVLISGTLVIVAGNFYRKNRSRLGAGIALLLGQVCMIIMALFANRLLLLPLYITGGTPQVFTTLLLTAILPFNAIKAVLISALTLLVYKPLSPLLKG